MHHVPQGKIFLRARHGPHPDTSFTPRHIQQHPDAGCPGRHLSRMRRTRSLYRLPVRPSDGSIDRGEPDLDIQQLFRSGTRFQREQQQCVRRCRKTQCPAQGQLRMADRFGTQQHLQFIRGGSERVAGFPQTARPQVRAPHTQRSQLDNGGSRGGSPEPSPLLPHGAVPCRNIIRMELFAACFEPVHAFQAYILQADTHHS